MNNGSLVTTLEKNTWREQTDLFPYNISTTAKIGHQIYLGRDVENKKNVEIGDYSYCSPSTIILNNVSIGKYCSIGYNVQIGCLEHPIDFLSTSPRIYRETKASEFIDWPSDDFRFPVHIGNDVWIGSNVIVLQGVTIGDGAIIAAGAVVNKDVEPFSIVGGVPAKKIRNRFDSSVEKIIATKQWWNLDVEAIEKFAEELYSK